MDLPDHFVCPNNNSKINPAPKAIEIPIKRYFKSWSNFYCGTNFFTNRINWYIWTIIKTPWEAICSEDVKAKNWTNGICMANNVPKI